MHLLVNHSAGRLITALLGGLGLCLILLALPSAAQADVNCSAFSNQAAAQNFFLANGGPSSDPNGLDADHDGIACESLSCPCNTSTGTPIPAPTPTPAPAPITGGGGGGGHHKHHHKHKRKHRLPYSLPPRPGVVYFPSKCSDKAFEPTGIIITCADVALRMDGLTWSSWDTQTAVGQGTMSYPNCDPSVAIAFCTTRASVPTTVTLDIPRYCPYVRHNSFTRLHSVAPTASGTWGDNNSLADYYQPFSCKGLKR